MTISNADRHDLHKALEAVLGEQRANVLMEHLPPVGWADVATKQDLDHLEQTLRTELTHEIGAVRTDVQLEISELRNSMSTQLLRHTMALIGIQGALLAVFNALG